MTENANGSIEQLSSAAATYAANLLCHYSFELGGYTVDELLARWLKRYPDNWVRLASIEALYQGRYKAVSVEQILTFWQRRGQPSYHFNHEFERLVCSKFPRSLGVGDFARVNPRSTSAPTYPFLDVLRRRSISEPQSETAPSQIAPSQIATSQIAASESATTSLEVAAYNDTIVPPDEQSDEHSVDELENRDPPNETLPLVVPPETPPSERASLYDPQWIVPSNGKSPIHRFTPAPESSEFYCKLKAVAHPAHDRAADEARSSTGNAD
ncbi:hypothetical protein [Leptolyngbya sp. FACHB-36]|uniref:hypothetical protein n=1 Tax=Leptolyngbya sp. FACHB-36 TaxID=2692808 RepID=UPI0018EFFE5F|nr:hypothetical protein [Leptolyngbya sp. FACHB-36]